MKKLTFAYVVGGRESYYANLERSIRSLQERVKNPFEVLVLNFGDKELKERPFLKEVKIEKAKILQSSDKRNWLQPHVWSLKYTAYKYAETDYCFYLDTDTTIINDKSNDLIEESEDKFMSTQHFWVPTILDYFQKVKPEITKSLKKTIESNLTTNCPFTAAGVFLFHTSKCRNIFETYEEIYKSLKEDGEEVTVSDELILSIALNKESNWKFTGGALNHCAANSMMPVTLRDGIWYGKNPFESKESEIFVFHSAIENIEDLRNYNSEFIYQKLRKSMYIDDIGYEKNINTGI